ncbi:uncharacterized protein LOC121857166 [Homarus americanus]|uniref:uncharacterized protein LOC121857166 n=1 Tax=Homarus americanus TaxID=6706 RepID=UPI001C46E876|nr:uncharacterized protein LOC121857166 [Homarus americanus]
MKGSWLLLLLTAVLTVGVNIVGGAPEPNGDSEEDQDGELQDVRQLRELVRQELRGLDQDGEPKSPADEEMGHEVELRVLRRLSMKRLKEKTKQIAKKVGGKVKEFAKNELVREAVKGVGKAAIGAAMQG